METPEDLVKACGGTKVVRRVLIANNGISAVKAIRSMRKWLFKILGNEKAISFVVLATPEDMKINAEYIRLGDQLEEVPGGSNNHNYANVDLIVDLAQRTRSDAVWAGWGHASENPRLPRALAKTESQIAFMGPHEKAMHDLGDKIASTLIAQAANVPTVPWSGDVVVIDYEKDGIPDGVFKKACISSLDELLFHIKRIGYPAMLKASEGGGGKGIRKVTCLEEVEGAYRQVQGEVPGSPIFLMRMVKNCHHLEVQVVADQYNDVICLFGRDCSVQRRHQKMIEEAPAVIAPPEVRLEMEKAAIRLAKSVRYVGVGTVEYLYSPELNEFYFLELNPRLQVEHPTTEQVTNVNLPAVQLCIAMGIPLSRIPDIREFYGREPYGDSPIIFEEETPVPPIGHVIAARITGENASDGFKPTNGRIELLNFRSASNVWGYFSVSSQDGGLHEFADSQFGHLFAHGKTRDEARKSLILALKELCIRGEVHTPVEYLISLLQTEEFKKNQMDTSSLDQFINLKSITEQKPDDLLVVVCGAVYKACKHFKEMGACYAAELAQGHTPTSSLIPYHTAQLIYNSVKYRFVVARTGPAKVGIRLANEGESASQRRTLVEIDQEKPIEAEFRYLGCDTLLILVNGKSHACTGKEEVEGMRFFINDQMCMFSADYDPTVVRLTTSGKLVRYLVDEGARISAGAAFAEMEVMKMFLTVAVQESGTIHLCQNEGAQLQAGDVLGTLTLDDPSSVSQNVVFSGKLPEMEKPRAPYCKLTDRIEDLFEAAACLVAGYIPIHSQSEENFDSLLLKLVQLCLSPHLPYLLIKDQLAAITGRIPEELFQTFTDVFKGYVSSLLDYASDVMGIDGVKDLELVLPQMEKVTANKKLSEMNQIKEPKYPKSAFLTALDNFLQKVPKSERGRISDSTRFLIEAERKFETGLTGYCQATLVRLLNQYVGLEEGGGENVEEIVCGGWGINNRAIDVAFFKNSCSCGVGIILSVFRGIEELGYVGDCLSALTKISMLYGKSSVEVSLMARQMLMEMKTLSYSERLENLYSEISQLSHPLPGEVQKEKGKEEAKEEKKEEASEEKKEPQHYGYDYVKGDEQSQERMHKLVTSIESLFHLLYPILSKETPLNVLRAAMQLYIERAYRAFSVKNLIFCKSSNDQIIIWSRFFYTASSGSEQSKTPSRVSHVSSEPNIEARSLDLSNPPVTPQAVRPCHFVVLESFDSFKACLSGILEAIGNERRGNKGEEEEGNDPYVLHVILRKRDESFKDGDCTSSILSNYLRSCGKEIKLVGVRRVTVAVYTRPEEGLDYFTFSSRNNFQENDILRNMEPTLGYRLELERMCNYNIKRLNVGTSPIHLYYGEEKKLGQREGRMFARTLVRGDSDSSDTLDRNRLLSFVEQRLSDAIKALGIALDRKEYSHARNNHIFLSILSTIAYDPEAVNGIIRWLGNRYGNRLFRLKVSCLELRCRLSSGKDAQTIPVLFEVKNPTSLKFNVHAYVEAKDSTTNEGVLFGLEAMGLRIGPLHGSPTLVPHELISSLQKKRYFCQGLNTTYAYDFLELWERAVIRLWKNFGMSVRNLKQGDGEEETLELMSPNPFARQPSELSVPNLSISQFLELERQSTPVKVPKDVIYSVELILNPDAPTDQFDRVLPNCDYLRPVSRPIGENDIGMVAWLVHYYSPEHSDTPKIKISHPSSFNIDEDDIEGGEREKREEIEEGEGERKIWEFLERHQVDGVREKRRDREGKGRWVVLISNDMTHLYGSFGPKEDALFFFASRFARLSGFPRIYISANSGARIGLAKEIQQAFRVSWNAAGNPKSGFSYLYLTNSDYSRLEKNSVVAERAEGCGCGAQCQKACIESGQVEECHWRINDVVGVTDGLGVENLKGSGLIAGETSRAYDDTFTITLVTGRSVGIGAYLVRLGQRAVQNQGPIILTGAPALNKVLGKDVYVSNNQLGGPQIMYPNGVSHIVVNDDLRGIQSILRWLSYIPPQVGAEPSVSKIGDPTSRAISYIPTERPYDPRQLLEGGVDPETGRFLEGFLDRDSFTETLAGWATSVVAGRGRIGGVPVGVLVVETRMREEVIPADPALPTSQQEIKQQPGQVWYPNTAFKTAQAIQDFNNGEELPLIIFANWRGFSGGMRDMFNEVLKFGAQIVDALKAYKQPVFIYLPPYAELRGGAWAVLDPSINPDMMEMYADPRSRGGVLEPTGTVEIKYRVPDLLKTMHRLDPKLKQLESEDSASPEVRQAIQEREQELLPVYQQIAVHFADLHDRPGRMMAKNCLNGIIEWEKSREFFYNRLQRRLSEERALKKIQKYTSFSREEAIETLKDLMKEVDEKDNVGAQNWFLQNEATLSDKIDQIIREKKEVELKKLLQQQKPADLQRILSSFLETADPSLRSSLLSSLSPQ